MAVIDLNTGVRAAEDDDEKISYIDLKTGKRVYKDKPKPVAPAPEPAQMTAEQRARNLGAAPGVALTPEQQRAISLGETIEPAPRSLEPNASLYKQRPPVDPDQNAFFEAYGQGLHNIGGGVLKMYGQLSDIMGADNAQKFLDNLAASQTMEQRDTDIVTRDNPVQRFSGEVLGETTGMGYGGSGSSLLPRMATSFGAGAGAGWLSATGRGGDNVDAATEAALGGGFGLLGEGATFGLRKYLQAKDAARVGGVEPQQESIADAAANINEAQAASRETGVRLLPAQQTLDPYLLEKQSFLGQHYEVSRRAFNVLREQNREVASALGGLLDSIAPPEAVATAGSRARDAAGMVISQAKKERDRIAGPLYRKAFREGADVDLTGVNDVIDDIMTGLPEKGSKMRNRLMRVRSLLKPGKAKAPDGTTIERPLSLRQLHSAKLEIDEMLEARGSKAVGATTRRHLMQIKSELLDAMSQSSPLYDTARREFEAASPAVNELMDGVFGRIEALDNKQLRTAGSIIFDAAESNPAIMESTIKTLKGVDGGEQLARDLLRSEMERRLAKMRLGVEEIAESGGRGLTNEPANIQRTLFGNFAQRQVFFRALKELDPAAARNALWLEKAMNRASAGRPGGSQTGIRNEIRDEYRRGFMNLRNWFRAPIESAAGLGEDAMYRERVRAAGQALYDPDWMPDMERIRRMDPNSPRGQSAFISLLDDIVDYNIRTGLSNQVAATGGRQLTGGE